MKLPKVTVLMSVFNDEEFCREAIDSILNQTFRDFELIILDDASTDKTQEVLQSYDDPRIVVIRNERCLGLTKSLNVGLRHVQSKYVARLDGDDVALAERLEKQVLFLDEHPGVGVVSNPYIKINSAGGEIGFQQLPTSDQAIRSRLFVANPFCHTSSMFRRHCVERVGSYREVFKMSQDYDLWLRIAEEFQVGNLEEPLCKVRIIGGSISFPEENRKNPGVLRGSSKQRKFASLACKLAIQRELFGEDELGYRPSGERYKKIRQSLSGSFMSRRKKVSNKYLIWSQRFSGYRTTAIRYLFRSLINHPLNLDTWYYIFERVFEKTKTQLLKFSS